MQAFLFLLCRALHVGYALLKYHGHLKSAFGIIKVYLEGKKELNLYLPPAQMVPSLRIQVSFKLTLRMLQNILLSYSRLWYLAFVTNSYADHQ